MPMPPISAKWWREMTTKDILASIEVALRVLEKKPMRQEELNMMFSILADSASIVKQRVVDKVLMVE